MSSSRHLRDFIGERLTAAAVEIFSVFEQTVIQYEKEIDRQRRLLENIWKPEKQMVRAELPLQHASEEEVVCEQQPCNQERISSPGQKPEPPLFKEEQEELCTSQEGDQLSLKQEPDTLMLTLTYGGSGSEPAPHSEQHLRHDSVAADARKASRCAAKSDSVGHQERKPISPTSERSCDPDTDKKCVKCDICGKPFKDMSQMRRHYRIHTGLECVPVVPSPEQCQPSTRDSCDSQDTDILSESPSGKRQKLDTEAKHLVESVLMKKPGGERIINEYNGSKSLRDETRRKMVNILAADMTEKNGTSPPRHVKEMYARGIVALFPHLGDPFSRNGYEHYYDGESGTGYLAWRIKTIQRSTARDRRSSYGAQSVGTSHEDGLGGPAARREPRFAPETVLSEDECKEAIALMKYSADEATIKKKMKLTFHFRRNMVLDPKQSNNILSVFPRFKDVKGSVEQDFVLMFGEDVSVKFLEGWKTTFKQNVIQQCRRLPSTSELENLLLAADTTEGTEVDDDSGWDSDLSSILLLLHLIPPSAQGRKRPGKVSASQAEKHLVVFKKTGANIQEHLDSITTSTQPYLLAVGRSKKTVHQFFIILNKNAVACRSTSSLGAFDELFKVHYVFATTYHPMLHNMFTFIQTTVYNIDVGKVKESPRVAEVRSRLLH